MSRLAERFSALRRAGRKALIPFITAGDPHPHETVRLMHALVAGGADIVELGVPFSDPMADGPVIQLACERALAHGTSLRQVVEMVRRFRQTDRQTPVVLMGYLNPVESFGYEAFAAAAAEAGVDGVLLVDLALEEAGDVVPLLRRYGLDAIFLLAPTSSLARIEHAAALGSGYLYYVSLKGVTGAGHLDVADVEKKLMEIRSCTTLPLAVGFGIRDAATAAQVSRMADGVVVGSALVSEIEKYRAEPQRLPERLQSRLGAMRSAMDAVLHQG